MYACLHVPAATGGSARHNDLLHLALLFSPAVEQTTPDTVVFSAAPLERVFGAPHQLASEIGRYGYECDLSANLALAANPDTAILLARNYSGVTFAFPGQEAEKLAPISLAQLFAHASLINPFILELLAQWGLGTAGDLAALPEKGVLERLGPPGVFLRNLALGRVHRPLRPLVEKTKYERQVDLEEPVETLEPLLFLFSRALADLCGQLRSQSQAARALNVRLQLEDMVLETEARPLEPNSEWACRLEFPVPLDQSRSILKVLHLHLEHYGPKSPVRGFLLHIEATDPKRFQRGLFLPPAPEPDKLQITIARIAGMVGQENIGVPALLDTHRPDAFELRSMVVNENASGFPAPPTFLRLALRIFRPALYAKVRTAGVKPQEVIAPGVEGRVVQAAGPWRISGDWWTSDSWARDEWDVELHDGALYRIYRESKAGNWYVQAIYD